jgi:hypothetical protein
MTDTIKSAPLDAVQRIPPEPRPLHEWVKYDPESDVVTVYDIRYSRELLRHIACSPPGVTFKIVQRRDGVVTISQERSPLEAAAPYMLAALYSAADALNAYAGHLGTKANELPSLRTVMDAIAKAEPQP